MTRTPPFPPAVANLINNLPPEYDDRPDPEPAPDDDTEEHDE